MTRHPAAVKSVAAERLRTAGARSSAQPDEAGEEPAGAGDCDALWALCLEIARLRRHRLPPSALARPGAGGGERGTHAPCTGAGNGAGVDWHPGRGWVLAGDWSLDARGMFDLYRPLLALEPAERYVLGHLGQSIDGRIATSSGDSCFINGQENLVHMHRLRALCDAVVVGATTVLADDPQLTTRLVPGPHATRVVIDPSRRLTPGCRVCSDDRCPTLVARLPAQPPAHRAGAGGAVPLEKQAARDDAPAQRCGRAEVIPAAASGTGIDLRGLLDTLADRGLHAILVEGGGITVSRFLEQGLLDRLQIAIAPVIIGSGRQGLQLPEVLALNDCLRPSCRQHRMGPDTLWDLDLRAGVAGS